MSSALERAFQALELLSTRPSGCPLSTLASELDIPLSASHRLLAELIKCGYVRQNPQDGQYVLTIKLVSVGLSFLSASGIVDVAQPLLDNLASVSGDLVRLAVVDGEDLTFVAKAQGATRGLRYDPDMGLSVALSCSAAGIAWLSTMSDDEAMTLVAKKGLGKPEDFGPKAPTSIKGVMALVKASRQQGFSMIVDVFGPGMSSMAAPVLDFQGRAIGVVTIAGPSVRLNAARMEALGPALLEAAQEVSRASTASSLFKKCA
ncbi:IclR family transcriptional regulator [Comamonas sp. BIGb0124]|uniref:IclR family transcriptional regulator n=1 Tax=Comamonas sp. BIGb0124 TaxID=2485130 RepID=UPI000F4695FB|nr:IclR family transcriptional regulator [Comamonas sp. BIGb0124]ROR23105.1 IclR family transcriptional regulator [Comamonas sp. BIGb0124]